MKIALVSHEYPPFRGGGIGTYTTIMSHALARAGHEVHVVTNRFRFGSNDPLHEKAVHREGNLWVHRIDALADDWEPCPPHDHPRDLGWQLHRHWSPYLYYAEKVGEALETICAEHGIDVAEFPECAAEGFAVIRRKRHRLAFRDLPVTVTLHSPIFEIYKYNLYSRQNVGFQRRTAMEEYCVRHADMVSSPTRLLARTVYERLQLPPEEPPCEVIPLPMDFDSLPEPGELARQRDPRAAASLLFVGRLEPRKGVRYLVDAAVKVMRRRPELIVTLIGRDCEAGEVPGPMTAYLRRRIPDAFQGNFIFCGTLPREQLFARYAAATACVFPAPWDNFPLTCVEAMASGACVIGSDHSGMAEMIEHERSGLLFRACDVDALAAAIQRALEDPQLVARIRAAAPARIREVCDTQTAVTNRIAHYERTIERHRGRAAVTLPASPRGRARVALFIPRQTDANVIQRTLVSARASATAAGVELDAVVGDPAADQLKASSGAAVHGHTGDADHASALRHWNAALAENPPDYVLTLWPGESLEPMYLTVTTTVLAQTPRAAWATTWALPTTAEGVPFAGLDFSLPLDLLAYHPVPFAVMRYTAWRQAGGLNADLPPGWREWDLLLACADAGLEGIVLPCWLGRYVPRADLAPSPPAHAEALSALLGGLAERRRRLVERAGVDLWLYRVMNSISTTLPPATAPALNGQWRDWWKVTKQCLKRQFPAAARAYRRWIKRLPA